MSRLKKLQDRNAALVKAMSGILDAADTQSRDLTDEETKLYSEHEAELTSVKAGLAREQQLQEYERGLNPVRDGNREADADAQGKADKADKPEQPKGFSSFGEMLQAVVGASDPRSRQIDPRLTIGAAATGMNETSKSDGGWLVEKDFSAELMKRTWETGQISSRVRKVPLSGNSNGLKMNKIKEDSRAAGYRFGGVRAYWTPEAGLKTASTMKIEQFEIGLNKLTGLLYATDELLQDASALESIVTDAFRQEFAWQLDDVILNGSGAGQPLGIMNSGALISITAETGQGATTLEFGNIVKMWARFWSQSKRSANAVWLINADVEPLMQSMIFPIGTGGIPVYLPPGGITQSSYGTLFGKPVIPVEQLATAGTTGDILLVDLNEYLLIDKGGMQTASSIHVRFIYDETAFRFVYRVGGMPTWDIAMTQANGSNTQSPYISLATRT